jgi:hypothetical protein
MAFQTVVDRPRYGSDGVKDAKVEWAPEALGRARKVHFHSTAWGAIEAYD